MVFILIVFTVSVCYGTFAAEVPKECDQLGVLIYEEIGCKAEYDNAQKCPSHYTCKKYNTDPEHCNFQGKVYKQKEMIDNSITVQSCLASCYCEGFDRLNCASIECPEFLGGIRLNSSCYLTHGLNSCCSTGMKCEPYDAIPTCQFEGKLYREGQKMYPKDRCYKCVCKSGFKGLLEEPFCKRYKCAFEKNKSKALEQNCALVYSNEVCCPSGYACPNGKEKFVFNKQNSNNKCKYGETLLNIGDTFEREVETYAGTRLGKCECKLPPLASCLTQ